MHILTLSVEETAVVLLALRHELIAAHSDNDTHPEAATARRITWLESAKDKLTTSAPAPVPSPPVTQEGHAVQGTRYFKGHGGTFWKVAGDGPVWVRKEDASWKPSICHASTFSVPLDSIRPCTADEAEPRTPATP